MTYTASGSTKFLKIGFVGLMQGSWAKYSQGYCQVLTVNGFRMGSRALQAYLVDDHFVSPLCHEMFLIYPDHIIVHHV